MSECDSKISCTIDVPSAWYIEQSISDIWTVDECFSHDWDEHDSFCCDPDSLQRAIGFMDEHQEIMCLFGIHNACSGDEWRCVRVHYDTSEEIRRVFMSTYHSLAMNLLKRIEAFEYGK